MFHDIGKKIKSLTSLITWVGIAGSLIGGMSISSIGGILVPVGIIVIVSGSVFSWVGSFLMYGFGELVDNSAKIAANLGNYTNPTASDTMATLRKWREQGLISEEDYQMKIRSLR